MVSSCKRLAFSTHPGNFIIIIIIIMINITFSTHSGSFIIIIITIMMIITL